MYKYLFIIFFKSNTISSINKIWDRFFTIENILYTFNNKWIYSKPVKKSILNERILSMRRVGENKYCVDILSKISISFTFYLISVIDVHTSFTKYMKVPVLTSFYVDTTLYSGRCACRVWCKYMSHILLLQ